MVFEIQGKIALITGGASGIGLEYAKALLKNGLRGVTLADVNPSLGETALIQLSKMFGSKKAIFVKTDVTKIDELEEAFKMTKDTFGNIDIVFNNAGILNDSIWEKEIAINVNGVINGMLLAMEKYLPAYQQGPEALIVNISSTAGIMGTGHFPIYSATKHAVVGITRSWGHPSFYDKHKVKVVGIGPGVTNTTLISGMKGKSLGGIYEANGVETANYPTQTPEDLAKEAMEVVKYAPNGTFWVIDNGEPAFQYVFPDMNDMKHNKISNYS